MLFAEFMFDRGNPFEFLTLVHDLEPAGELSENKSYKFDFGSVDKSYETYFGTNVRLRYESFIIILF